MRAINRFNFLFILLPLLAAGCVTFTPEEPAGDCTILASCPQTKTGNDGLATYWYATDELSLFVGAQGDFSNSKFSYVGNDRFKGRIPATVGTQIVYAAYPYTPEWTSPAKLSIDVDPEPRQTGNGSTAHLVGPGFPLFGISDTSGDIAFAMDQLLAVGRFNIKNGDTSPIKIKSIEFVSPVAVAGEFEVDITGASPVYHPVQGNTTSTVTLSVASGAQIAVGQSASFYAGFIPFDASGDFQIKVTAESNGAEWVSTKEIKGKRIALKAGEFTALNYTYANPSPAVPEVYLGSFNLVNEDMDSYMAVAEKVYTDSNWRGYSASSIVGNYRNGDNGDLNEPAGAIAYSYDRPVPVSIPVDGNNGKMVSLSITGDGAFADEKYESFTQVINGKVQVYNLIPNRRYHYTVSLTSGEILSIGYFDTSGRRRIMKVSDVVSADKANNFRDLGGMRTLDGKTLKYGKVFRGTNMDGLTTSEKSYMTDDLNIGLDVDLRRATDSGRNQAKRILDASKVDYSNVGFMYSDDLKNHEKIKSTILSILNTLQSGKSVYIHCFAGADRTGCICMLLEALCGVSEKDCTIDYELTSFSCVSTRTRTTDDGFMGFFHPYLSGLSGSTFKAKAERFLLDCGLTATQISDLQNALINNE